MRLNPFKVDFLKDLFVFHEKNNFMFLKIYSINKTSNLKIIMNLAKEKMVNFSDLYYCLNIHYDGKEKKHYFSINSKWNGEFYKISDVDSLFHELDSNLGDRINHVQNPYTDLFFLPFHGVENFLVKIARNRIYLHDPSSKEILQILAMFEVNLHNIEIFPTFFKLIDDLALKMKINIDINIMFKNENKQSYMDAFFTFVEKKEHKFNEILEKLKNTNEFNVILKECQLQKKDVVKLFIRRMIGNQASYTTLDALQFFSKYLVEESGNTNGLPSKDGIPKTDLPNNTDAGSLVGSEKVNVPPQDSFLPLSLEEIQDASISAFQAVIKREGDHGKFLDSKSSVFDDGTRIYAIIHGLSVKGLYLLLKTHINKRTFKFFFVDPEELSEYTRQLAPSLENICKSVVLSENIPGDVIPVLQTE
jgi:hypothetical protein